MQNSINNTYEHQLAYHFHNIDNRGLLIDTQKKDRVLIHCNDELARICNYLSQFWNISVYVGAGNASASNTSTTKLNVNAHGQKLEVLKNLGYDVPKIRKKNEETDEYEFKESVGELALVKLLADPSRWPSPTSGDGIKKLLELAEIITFKNRYLNARLYKNVYICNYNVGATLTGRRGSKKHIYGIGGNAQNFPARGSFSDLWKECIISRPDRIFLFVDQISAEDWPVQALSNNTQALDEMRQGVNRHYKFASQIFGITVDDLKAIRNNKNGLYTKEQQDTAEMQYYMGKKGRHANNYGMQPTRFSEALASEGGFTVPVDACKNILNIIDRIDPNVKRVFHKYIQEELSKPTHLLRTPLGRERQFLGLRSGEKNYSIINEGFAWIPQSLIGDNTGLAVCHLEICHPYILQDGHDSLCQEVPDKEEDLRKVFRNTGDAFKRVIKFHNGIEIEIPIEAAIGYNWKDKIKLDHYTEDELIKRYKEVHDKYKKESTTCEELMPSIT
jgi:hypothetical protein